MKIIGDKSGPIINVRDLPDDHPLNGSLMIFSVGSRVSLEPKPQNSETAPAPPESPPSKLET